jgi:ribonuclease BN (tRNA processing enzyme)
VVFDPPVRLTVIGSSPAWPNPGGAQSGYLLEGPGRLLLDCGPGVLARLRESASWPELDAIAISHFHLDHWGDIVPWAWGAIYGPGREAKQLQLHLPPRGRQLLAGLALSLGGMADMFERAFEVSEYADREVRQIAGFKLTPMRLHHYREESYGFRVVDGRTTLAYSADSGPNDTLVELARDADLFLCEATLADGEPEPRGHLSLAEAEAAFAASGARRLLVTHRPEELPVGRGIELAHDGLELEL